jgi:5-methylcytosine-specific restriction endonuclease McrA
MDEAREKPKRVRDPEYFRAYRAAHRDEMNAARQRWRDAHPEQEKANQDAYCAAQEPDITLTADHVVPLSRGGANDIGKIQPLCGSCNSRKHTKIVDYRPS